MHQLKGKYFYTARKDRAASTLGFNTNLTPINGSTFWIEDVSGQGEYIFNGNGTGTAQGKHIVMWPLPFDCSATDEFSNPFTYSVASDGTVTIVLENFKATFLTGPWTGMAYTVNSFSLSGMVSTDLQTLTFATQTPSVIETLTMSNGVVHYQICGVALVMIRMEQ